MTASVKAYRSFVLSFVLLFVLAPCAMMSLNYSVDPNNRYGFSVKASDLSRLSHSKHLYLTLPDNYDDRALLKKYIFNAPKPSLVVFGSSRVLNIQAEMFKNPWSDGLMNMAMLAGTIRDYVALWQTIKSQGGQPQYILLCIEQQSLNSYSQNNRFLSVYEYYSQFFNEGGSFRIQFMGLTTNVKDLLSLGTTLASIRELRSPRRRGGELVLKAEHERMILARSHSFSMIYPRRMDFGSAAEVLQAGKENGLGEHEVFKKWNREDRMGYDHLTRLIRDMKQSGVTPIVIGMPYHPAAYEIIARNETAAGNMHHFVKELENLAEQEGIVFYNAITENHETFKNEDFMDGAHLKMLANYRLIRRATTYANADITSDTFVVDSSRA